MINRVLFILSLYVPVFVLSLGFDVPTKYLFFSLVVALSTGFIFIDNTLYEICKLLKEKNNEEEDEKKKEEN